MTVKHVEFDVTKFGPGATSETFMQVTVAKEPLSVTDYPLLCPVGQEAASLLESLPPLSPPAQVLFDALQKLETTGVLLDIDVEESFYRNFPDLRAVMKAPPEMGEPKWGAGGLQQVLGRCDRPNVELPYRGHYGGQQFNPETGVTTMIFHPLPTVKAITIPEAVLHDPLAAYVKMVANTCKGQAVDAKLYDAIDSMRPKPFPPASSSGAGALRAHIEQLCKTGVAQGMPRSLRTFVVEFPVPEVRLLQSFDAVLPLNLLGFLGGCTMLAHAQLKFWGSSRDIVDGRAVEPSFWGG